MNWKSLIDQAKPRPGMTVSRDGILYTILEVRDGSIVLRRKWREKPGSDMQSETIAVAYNGPK